MEMCRGSESFLFFSLSRLTFPVVHSPFFCYEPPYKRIALMALANPGLKSSVRVDPVMTGPYSEPLTPPPPLRAVLVRREL